MKLNKDPSVTLGIVSLAVGWALPLAGIICSTVGLAMRKQEKTYNKAIALNTTGLIISLFAWLVWTAFGIA